MRIRPCTAVATTAAIFLSACAHTSSCTTSACAEQERALRAQVMQQLDARAALRFANIEVQVSDHDVYLYGMVDTRLELDSATEIAQDVPGVHHVYNGIGVLGNSW